MFCRNIIQKGCSLVLTYLFVSLIVINVRELQSYRSTYCVSNSSIHNMQLCINYKLVQPDMSLNYLSVPRRWGQEIKRGS